MGYILKENVAKEIRKKYKNGYLALKTGYSPAYISLIFHRKRIIPLKGALAFVNAIGSNLKIEDIFEIIEK